MRAVAHAPLQGPAHKLQHPERTRCASALFRTPGRKTHTNWLLWDIHRGLQVPIDNLRSRNIFKPFKCTCKMATQVDLVRVKVENKIKESLERDGKEKKKKKKKREHSPSVGKYRSEKEVKKAKLHHYNHQHGLSRSQHPDTQPQLQRQTHTQPRTFTKEQVPVQQRHHHHNNHHHHHEIKREGSVVWSKMTPTKLQKPPAPTVMPSAPLFTFTPLKVAKAKSLTSNKEKHNGSDFKLKPKNENTDAHIKTDMLKKKKKGIFSACSLHILFLLSDSKWLTAVRFRDSPTLLNLIRSCMCFLDRFHWKEYVLCWHY